jgi:4'-phosphopantetheinyl transferase
MAAFLPPAAMRLPGRENRLCDPPVSAFVTLASILATALQPGQSGNRAGPRMIRSDPLLPVVELPCGAVHLWYTPVWAISDRHLARYPDLLTTSELTRWQRYRFAKDRRHYLVTRALLRTVLSHYFPQPLAAWRFHENRFGKPEIDPPPGCPPLRFNLSNTDGLAVCAVTLKREIGVDAEHLRRKVGLDIARSFFASDEADYLDTLPPERQHDAFLAFWTLKEAYVQARGDGLSLPLDRFAFTLDPVTIRFAPDLPDDPAHWQFVHLQPTPDHLVAVAVQCAAGEILEVIPWEMVPASR